MSIETHDRCSSPDGDEEATVCLWPEEAARRRRRMTWQSHCARVGFATCHLVLLTVVLAWSGVLPIPGWVRSIETWVAGTEAATEINPSLVNPVPSR